MTTSDYSPEKKKEYNIIRTENGRYEFHTETAAQLRKNEQRWNSYFNRMEKWCSPLGSRAYNSTNQTQIALVMLKENPRLCTIVRHVYGIAMREEKDFRKNLFDHILYYLSQRRFIDLKEFHSKQIPLSMYVAGMIPEKWLDWSITDDLACVDRVADSLKRKSA